MFSSDIKFMDENRGICLHSTKSYSTMAVAANAKLDTNTIAFWEIEVELLYGTSIMFGIGTENARQNAPLEFLDLLGEDKESYGFGYDGILQHDGKKRKYSDKLRNDQSKMPCSIGMLFDGPKRTLSYHINLKPLGVAFSQMDLNNKIFYPMISSTAHNSVFKLKNEHIRRLPPTLLSITIEKITKSLNRDSNKELFFTNIPLSIANQMRQHC